MNLNAHGMEIYLNTADTKIIKRLMDLYSLDGVTTNPELVAQVNNPDYKGLVHEIRDIIGDKKLFLQATANDYDNIMKEAEVIREIGGSNTIVKIPCTPGGLKAIKTLDSMGIPTLGTQILSAMQGILALKAGAEYIAPFYGCMNEAGIDGKLVFDALVKYREVSQCKGQILGCAPFNQTEVAWMFTTGITAITLMPWDFDDGVEFEAFLNLNAGVRKSWESVYGDGKYIFDVK